MANEDYKVPLHAAWLLRHVNGCGKPAFYMAQEPVWGLLPEAHLVWYPDGSQPEVGDMVKCGSCGARLDVVPNVKDTMIEYCEKR